MVFLLFVICFLVCLVLKKSWYRGFFYMQYEGSNRERAQTNWENFHYTITNICWIKHTEMMRKTSLKGMGATVYRNIVRVGER